MNKKYLQVPCPKCGKLINVMKEQGSFSITCLSIDAHADKAPFFLMSDTLAGLLTKIYALHV